MPHLEQILGNASICIAAVLYALPLQRLVRELARKKEDGGGAIAGAIILLPMWTLLLIGVLAAIGSGDLDTLGLRHGALYSWVTIGTIALCVVSFISLMLQARATWTKRVLFGAPVYAGPLLTVAFVAGTLNPSIASYLPMQAVRLAWGLLTALCLLICTALLIRQLGLFIGKHATGFVMRLTGNRELARQDLERIATLGPENNFDDLLRLANRFNPRDVRERALARLRTHPDFVSRLATALNDASPDNALALLEWAELSGAELEQLAPAVRDATMQYAQGMRESLRYAHKSRRKLARRWGRYLLRRIAKRFSATGEDFAPTLAAFEAAFDSHETV